MAATAAEGDSHRRTVVATAVGIGLIAAVPSIAWAIVGPDFIHDDFWVSLGFQTEGVLPYLWQLATEAPARPGAALYYLFSLHLLGDRPVAQALLLSALNAGLAAGVWLVARHVVRPRTALLAALVFAVVPNRGSTRLWFVIGPYLVALGLVLLAVYLLARHRRVRPAAAVLGAAVLVYEGVVGVALLVAVMWSLTNRTDRARTATALATPPLAAAGLLFLLSPKRDAAGPAPFENVGTLGHAQFGDGFWGLTILGTAGALLFLALIGYAGVRALPSFGQPHNSLAQEVLLGAATVAAGVAPFVVVGAPLAVSGVFDRNNLSGALGASVILGAVLAEVWRRGSWGAAPAVVVACLLLIGNASDVRDYRRAAEDGQNLVAQVMEDVEPSDDLVLVGPPLEDHRGVAQFILGGNLTSALVLREGEGWANVRMPAFRSECRRLVMAAESQGQTVRFYDRERQRLLAEVPEDRCGA